MSESYSAVAQPGQRPRRRLLRRPHRIWWNGRWYRGRMRLLHRFDLCWMRPVPVEPGRVRCDWCGVGGKRTTQADLDRAAADLTARRERRHA